MISEQVEQGFKDLEIDNGGPPSILTQVFVIPVISDVMFKLIGLSERQTLRSVSHLFADFVQNQLLKLTELKVSTVDNGLVVELDNFQLKYLRSFSWDPCQINRGRKTVVSSVRLENIIVKDLKLIFKHKTIKINQFSLEYGQRGMDNLPLPETNLRLKVKKFRVLANQIDQVRSGLTILDPKSIEEIWIDTQSFKCIQSPDIVSHWKAQWKMAKVLVSKMRFETKQFVANFGHFDYMHFVVENTRISLGVLEILKDTLLLRPSLQKFEIVPASNHSSRDALFIVPPRSFKAFQDCHNPSKFIFPYPNSKEFLKLEISYNGIVFEGPAYSGDRSVKKEDPRELNLEEMIENDSMYAERPYVF